MYFLKGTLPWQGLQARTKKEKYDKIKNKKIQTTPESLCVGYPQEFATYLRYCRDLKFDMKPDYSYLRKLFRDLFIKNGYECDWKYDWTSQKLPPKKFASDTKLGIFVNSAVVAQNLQKTRVVSQENRDPI
jgi:hypothetical protein